MRVVPDAASASGVCGLGLGVFDEEAFAVGATALPSPTDDIDFDWVWHQLIPFPPSVGTEVVDELGTVMRIPIDGKAQRKLTPGDVLGWMVDGVTLAASPLYDGVAACRFLVMLS